MNKILINTFFLFFATLFFSSSCKEAKKEEKTAQTPQETTLSLPGSFNYHIVCRTDQTQSYTAYFPVSYKPGVAFPILIVFDAHARSKMAANKFRQIADEFGYLVIVSNNAKNGLKTVNQTINALFEDVFQRFSIDTRRVYTAGFSGGARIASSIAINKGGIAGVLAIAGGLPQVGQEVSHKFDFAAVVGIEDFNYQELKALDQQMESLHFPHSLIVAQNGHEWPDGKTLHSAVSWLEIQAMKRADIPVNDNLIRNYSQQMADSINGLVLKNKIIEAKTLYEQFLSTLNGLYDISGFQKSYRELLENPELKKQEQQAESLAKYEAEKQQLYISLFKAQSFSKISTEINGLNTSFKAKNEFEKHSAKRLLNYMSMLSYIFTDNAFKSEDLSSAAKYLDIYNKVDKDNPDYYFFEACILASNKKTGSAIKKLQKAVEFGFFDTEKLEIENRFSEIHKSVEFKDIVAKAKVNFEN